MDKYLVLGCLDLIRREVDLAIKKKDNINYHEGYKMVVDKTMDMIKTNKNIVTILNQIKEYKKKGEMHQLSLFSNGKYDAANEMLVIIYNHLGEDNYDE